MHIARQTHYFVITRHEPKGLFLAAFFLLFALIMDLRKTFTFDAGQRIVRWNGRKVFKAEWGEIRFDDITEIGTEASAGERGVPIYRLTIITPRATIPMAYAYSGHGDRYSHSARTDPRLRQARLNDTVPRAWRVTPQPEIISVCDGAVNATATSDLSTPLRSR
jgi:hypothetical protein